ncbi:MAG: DUF5119 domain-containing protein [Rikenellaceae bacterium]
MSRILRYIYLALALLVLGSCYRKPLYDECICHTTATIPIDVDWEISEVAPQNVTVLVYDATTDELYMEHIYEHNDNEIQSYISLPVGEYKVVIFNELRNQIDYVTTSEHSLFSTLNFYARTTTPTMARAYDNNYLQEPGALALTVVEDLEITDELIVYTYSTTESTEGSTESTKVSDETIMASTKLTNLVAERKSSRLDIVFHIGALENALMPALADIYNISNGYNVSGECNNYSPSNMQFNMNNRKYDEGTEGAGTISASVTLFGSLGDRMSTDDHTEETPIVLDILFMLRDEEQTIVSRVVDVTDLIEFSVESNGNILMDLYVECDDYLPTVIVTDDGSSSGLETSLAAWEGIDVPPISI